ncbi:hypothetical protein OBBRIDRAFT_837470 [Obba rivulosa]|uniref:SUN domain-containing protein n=1 Tax=Obba rivulosa TaxID=1052685 RepID=A0A8E2ASS5_9APHY|nr:hypothetical protein OBBRIDRAFT_837470 [Obba rivulosa]
MLSFLPASLLALVFASPVFSAPSSPNDPFREIAALIPKQPEPPICCLRPLTPLEPATDEELLLSFEDWKAKRFAEASARQTQQAPVTHLPPTGGQKPGGSAASDPVSEPPGADAATPSPQGMLQDGALPEPEDATRLAPHFRIPTVDRFNYASLDCSARVHTAHRSAKSPAAILASKKDKYMLSPCAEKNQFVVVELCEDIRIDTVQLANFEFFSGVFKDFTVSVAKTYTVDTEGWAVAGTYRAQNVRGVQSFHLPTSLRDFYRFIRIDFHSHYGNEYYCPVSLLRVYGLTHLEEWKWEMWERESQARRAVEEVSVLSEVSVESPQVVHIPAIESREVSDIETKDNVSVVTDTISSTIASPASAMASTNLTSSTESSITPSESQSSPETTALTQSVERRATAEYSTSTAEKGRSTATTTQDHDLTQHETTHDTSLEHTMDSVYITSATSSHSVSLSSPSPESPPHSSANSSSADFSSSISHSDQATRSSQAHTTIPPGSATLPSVPLAPPAPPVTTGGESIYRTIMNRLTALEANTTLYARYVEEQTAGVREVLRRLGEDVGRLDGIGKAQAQMYRRSIVEFDKQRRRLEHEHSELLLKINRLTDEVILEKRLGIAQLCLLLAVIVFMVMTRGSRGEPIHARLSKPSAMRDWGRRTLSFSGEWVNKFRSRSPTPQPREQFNDKVDLSQTLHPFELPPPHSDSRHVRSKPSQLSSAPRKSLVRPRTPSALRLTPTSRHFNIYSRAATSGSLHSPTRSLSRPQIQRASSGSAAPGLGAVPKSTKRWARTAHLHEVKSTGVLPTMGRLEQDENVVNLGGDVVGPRRGSEGGGFAFEDADDFFGAGTVQKEYATPKGKGKERMRAVGRPPLSPLRLTSANELALGCSRARAASDVASDGDGWVDTDVDAPESDLDVGSGRLSES